MKHRHYNMIIAWAKDPTREVEFFNTDPLSDHKWKSVGENNTPSWNPELIYRFKVPDKKSLKFQCWMADDELSWFIDCVDVENGVRIPSLDYEIEQPS